MHSYDYALILAFSVLVLPAAAGGVLAAVGGAVAVHRQAGVVG